MAGPFPPGRPLSVMAGPFPSWPAPFRHGRPLSVTAGPFPSWPGLSRPSTTLSPTAPLVRFTLLRATPAGQVILNADARLLSSGNSFAPTPSLAKLVSVVTTDCKQIAGLVAKKSGRSWSTCLQATGHALSDSKRAADNRWLDRRFCRDVVLWLVPVGNCTTLPRPKPGDNLVFGSFGTVGARHSGGRVKAVFAAERSSLRNRRETRPLTDRRRPSGVIHAPTPGRTAAAQFQVIPRHKNRASPCVIRHSRLIGLPVQISIAPNLRLTRSVSWRHHQLAS